MPDLGTLPPPGALNRTLKLVFRAMLLAAISYRLHQSVLLVAAPARPLNRTHGGLAGALRYEGGRHDALVLIALLALVIAWAGGIYGARLKRRFIN